MATLQRNLGRNGTKEDQIDTTPVLQLVRDVLARDFRAPYPEDITDRVCLAIEANPNWKKRYDTLVADFSSTGKNGRDLVNNSIGYFTKRETGMQSVRKGVKAKSSLIKTYTKLA